MLLKEYFSNKNVVVSGHTGFKGSWLTVWLKALDARVIGISLDPPTKPSHFKAAFIDRDIQDLRIDLRNRKSVQKAIKNAKPKFVFHLAAQPLKTILQ